jgi:ABC-2 type transport system permease protein
MGGTLPVIITAVFASFLGTTLGLFVSAFAQNEFQAVQMVLPIIMPQVLLCGLFVARDQMAKFLQWLSDIFPVTYSVDAMKQVTLYARWTSDLTRDLVVIGGCGVLALVLGAATIRRRE